MVNELGNLKILVSWPKIHGWKQVTKRVIPDGQIPEKSVENGYVQPVFDGIDGQFYIVGNLLFERYKYVQY